MKISSNGLQAFYSLALEKNFTKAAKKIGLSQPAFSQRIKSLEDTLETTLVIRERQGVMLTASGQKLLKFCKTNIQIEDELLRDIHFESHSNSLSGQIRIGGFSSIMRSVVLPSLQELLIENPDLGVQTFTAELSDIPEMLRSSKVDFVIYNRPIMKEGLHNECLGVEENVLVQSKECKNEDVYLDHDDNDVTTSSYFSLAKMDGKIKKRYLDDVYGLLDGVKMGLGKAVLPKHLIDSPDLKIKNPKIVMRVPLYLVYHHAAYYTETHKKVVQEIRNHFHKSFKSK